MMVPYSTGALIERCGLAHGPDVAVVFGDRRITYHEQLARIRQNGRALLKLGLRRGDRVALLMTDCPELLDVYFGLLWAGLAVVPLHPKGSAADHALLIGDSGARAIVHDVAQADKIPGADTEFVLCVDRLRYLADKQPDGPGMPEVSPTDLYGIFYTGGEDGRPKGAVHTHSTYLSAIAGEMVDVGLGERDRFAHAAPLTHAGGMFVLPTWIRGGTNVLLGGFDPERFAHTVAAERITATMMVPTMLYRLMDSLKNGNENLESLSTVVYGVSPFRHDRLLQALDTFGPVFIQLYGQAEAPNQLTVLRKSDHTRAVETGDLSSLSSLGRPVSLSEVRLTHDGEIIARGPHITPGYWNRPDETANTLRGGWLRTGDVATADDRGFLHLVSRKKDLIISGGYHVYAEHVESALSSHPAVRDVAVIGVPDDTWGESVKAVVVADPTVPVAAAELIAWAKEHRGSVSAPKTIDFVESIPLTTTGKHDKHALRATHSGKADHLGRLG